MIDPRNLSKGTNLPTGFYDSYDYAGNAFEQNTYQPQESDFNVGFGGDFDYGNGGILGKDKEDSPFGLQGIAAGIKGFGALTDAYLGYKSLGLSRDQFDFAKGSFNKNLANQAKLANLEIEARKRRSLTSKGGVYDTSTTEGRALIEKEISEFVEPRKISGAPI